MKHNSSDGAYFVAVITALLVVLALWAWADYATCMSKTERIGFDRDWSLVGGCLIEVSQDQWIPLESYYFKQE